jgi:hypothetical protein
MPPTHRQTSRPVSPYTPDDVAAVLKCVVQRDNQGRSSQVDGENATRWQSAKPKGKAPTTFNIGIGIADDRHHQAVEPSCQEWRIRPPLPRHPGHRPAPIGSKRETRAACEDQPGTGIAAASRCGLRATCSAPAMAEAGSFCILRGTKRRLPPRWPGAAPAELNRCSCWWSL